MTPTTTPRANHSMRILCQFITVAVLLLACASPSFADAARVSFDADNTACSSTTWPASVVDTSSCANCGLIISLTWFDTSGDSTATPTVNASSSGITSVDTFHFLSNLKRGQVWRMENPPADATLDITGTFSNNADGECALVVVAYSGVHQTTMTGTATISVEAVAATCSVSPSGGDATGMVVQAMYGAGNTVSWSHTLVAEFEGLDGGASTAGFQETTGASATLIATQGLAAATRCLGVPILVAAGAAGAPRPRHNMLGIIK